jgi:hypothetical protein
MSKPALQLNPSFVFKHLHQINFNNILASTLVIPQGLLSLTFPDNFF